jgi:hypothetical protein
MADEDEQELGGQSALLSSTLQQLDDRLSAHAWLQNLEQGTGVPKTVFAGLTLLALLITAVSWFGAFALCNLAAFLYPAFASFQVGH